MAKKDVTAIESGAGFIGSLACKLVKRARQAGVSDEEIHELIKEGDISDVMIDKMVAVIFTDNKKNVSARNIYPVSVDYAAGMEEMVRRGKYDWSNSNITTKHFPTKHSGKADIKIKLVHFDRSIGSENAIEELDKMGLRPAEGCELLAFGEKYPEVQREFPINALGSVWRGWGGGRRVVCLGRGGALRDASLDDFGGGWLGRWRFAAVRK